MARLTKKKQEEQKKICQGKCQRTLVKSTFYNTSDTDFYPDGKIGICKKCCGDLIEEKGFTAFQTLMRMINKPIYDKLYENQGYAKYIRTINSMPQYKDKIYNDSDLFQNKNISVSPALEVELDNDELKSLKYMFGEGYEDRDYAYMKLEFEDYLNKYEVESKTLESLIREIIITQIDIRKARANNQDVKGLLKVYQDLMTSANLKPVQETGSQSVSQESFGTLIKKWENERPIPEPDPKWRDVDGVKKYVETFFFGHLAKLFGKENESKLKDEYDEYIEEYTVRPPREDD